MDNPVTGAALLLSIVVFRIGVEARLWLVECESRVVVSATDNAKLGSCCDVGREQVLHNKYI